MNSRGANSRCISRTRAGSRANVATPKLSRPNIRTAKFGAHPCMNSSAEPSASVAVVRIFGRYRDTHQLTGSVRNRFPRNAADP